MSSVRLASDEELRLKLLGKDLIKLLQQPIQIPSYTVLRVGAVTILYMHANDSLV